MKRLEDSIFSKRDLVHLIWPLVVEQILNATIGIADTLMVSSVGETAVSGVSLVDSINLLVLYLLSALAAGGAIVAAQYLGKGEPENANIAAKQLVLVTTGISLVLMLICIVGRNWILGMLFSAAEPAVSFHANSYFQIIVFSYPFMALYNAAAALFRAQGNSRVSMMAALVMNVVNISGNALLIYVFKMGSAGAATASTISRGVGAVMLMVLLLNPHNKVYLESFWSRDTLRLRPAMIKQILRIGVPNSLENVMFNAGKLILSSMIAVYGTVAIAANALANNIMTLSQIPGVAVGLAMITVVGQCVGAREFDQAKRYMIRLTIVSYLLMTVSNLLTLPILPKLVALYGVSDQTAATAIQISVCCIIGNILLWSASFSLPNGLRAASDVRFPLMVSMFSMWVFRVGLGYFLGTVAGLGVLGVWIAMNVDWSFRMILFLVRLFSDRWRGKATV